MRTLQEVLDKLQAENRLHVCGACGESFDVKVWHCRHCAHHWPMSRNSCWNCHRGTRIGSFVARLVPPDAA